MSSPPLPKMVSPNSVPVSVLAALVSLMKTPSRGRRPIRQDDRCARNRSAPDDDRNLLIRERRCRIDEDEVLEVDNGVLVAGRDIDHLQLAVGVEREREVGDRAKEHGRIRTQATVEDVAAGPTNYDVVAAEGRDGVIAGQRVDEVGAVGADKYVVACGSHGHCLGRKRIRGRREYSLGNAIRIDEPAD